MRQAGVTGTKARCLDVWMASPPRPNETGLEMSPASTTFLWPRGHSQKCKLYLTRLLPRPLMAYGRIP